MQVVAVVSGTTAEWPGGGFARTVERDHLEAERAGASRRRSYAMRIRHCQDLDTGRVFPAPAR
jgi:hypothetical protein